MSGKKLKGIPYTGTLPTVLTGTKAGYLHGYKIYGNLTQNGTPTPSDPIVPSECGELETTGVHAGQYKLPLSSAGQSVDIYLGESQTTRRIKKLVLTGSENWLRQSESHTTCINLYVAISNAKSNSMIISNVATYSSSAGSANDSIVNVGRINGAGTNLLMDMDLSDFATITAWKAYLAQQYANGTPVTIWYVLATEETGTLNEPLRKIGDYADIIDSSQTSVQIPTSAGSTTISWAGEGLAPSEFDSIQEWVDISTYKRVNGEWVANSETPIYGFHVDPSVADPANAVTYLLDAVGKAPATNSSSVVDYSDWANAFFMPKPCMLYYNGTVAYYLDPNDYTKKADGSPSDVANPLFPGNAMMEWPVIWWKFEAGEAEGEMSFYVSDRQVDSTYHCWCNIDAENHITDHFYTAIYNGTSATTYSDSDTYAVGDLVTYSSAEYRCTTAVETPEAFDSTKWEKVSDVTRLRSLSGKALTAANGNGSTTGTDEVQRATANNTTATVEWYTDVFSDRQLINGLLTLVSKTLDSSAVYGRGLDSGGREAKEAYITGTLNDKGLFWGNPSAGTSAKKCFGMENWDGCVWHRTAGLIGSSSTGGYAYKLTYNTADGSTATSYNSTGLGYLVGATGDGTTIARPANGYVTAMKVDSATGIWLPGTVGGSTSTYYCDNYYDGSEYGLAGGNSSGNEHCGCWYLNLGNTFGRAVWIFAASPSCKPLASRYHR
jgi:hypothetical protein